MDAAVFLITGRHLRIKGRTKNGTEGFSCRTKCFHFTPDWLWQELQSRPQSWAEQLATGQQHAANVALRKPIGSLEQAKVAMANLIGPLQCDGQILFLNSSSGLFTRWILETLDVACPVKDEAQQILNLTCVPGACSILHLACGLSRFYLQP